MQDKHYLIGQRIKEIRMRAGLSQSKAAEAIGVAQSHMSNIETGRSHVTMENLMALRDLFGVKMADFSEIWTTRKQEPRAREPCLTKTLSQGTKP